MIAGLLLAVGCALATSASVLFKQRGAVAALLALGAWLSHVGALSLAALSIVQAVICGGLVFLAIVAERFFGFQLGRRQWTRT